MRRKGGHGLAPPARPRTTPDLPVKNQRAARVLQKWGVRSKFAMKSLTVVLAVPLFVLTGCPRQEKALTLDEATEALQQASDAGQAEGLMAVSVDISTHFTIGQAVKEG